MAEVEVLSPGISALAMEINPDIEYKKLRSIINGSYIANGNYNAERAEQSLANGLADFISFGAPFIANPSDVKNCPEKVMTSPDLTSDGIGSSFKSVEYNWANASVGKNEKVTRLTTMNKIVKIFLWLSTR